MSLVSLLWHALMKSIVGKHANIFGIFDYNGIIIKIYQKSIVGSQYSVAKNSVANSDNLKLGTGKYSFLNIIIFYVVHRNFQKIWAITELF